MEVYVLIGLGIIAGLLIFLLFDRNRAVRENAHLAGLVTGLQREVQNVVGQVTLGGESMRRQIQDGLVNVVTSVEKGRETMASQLDTIYQTHSVLSKHLGNLETATAKVEEMGRDVLTLQKILSSPKLRGNFGEFSLERELGDILPSSSFQMQFDFALEKAGTADAVLFLPNGKLAIDAKFPLENYQKYREAQETEERDAALRKFKHDVKVRITETAGYIIPAAGTLNFAIMYVPSEAVYYDAFIADGELLEVAMERHVYPASPSTLHVYLWTVAIGLRGLKIEENAYQILRDLQHLGKNLSELIPSMDTAIKQLNYSSVNLAKSRAMLMDTMQLVSSFGYEEVDEGKQS
jgi:DNA recombination protein RmuC